MKKKKTLIIIIVLIIVFLIIAGIANKGKGKIEKVKVVKIEKAMITGYVYTNGTLRYENVEDIIKGLNGYLNKVYIKRGESFKKGAELFEIKNSEFLSSLYFDFIEKQLNYNSLKKEYGTNELLYKKGGISKKQKDDIYRTLKRAEITYKNHKYWQYKRLGFVYDSKSSIFGFYANTDGVILNYYYDEGDVISEMQAIITISKGSGLIAEFNVNILDSQKIKRGNSVNITSDVLPSLKISGHITSISLNPEKYGETKIIKVYSQLNIKNKVPNDLPIDGRIIYTEKENIIKVPVESLRENYNMFQKKKNKETKMNKKNYFPYFVYTIKKKENNNGIIEKKLVKVGIQNDFFVEVSTGVSQGDLVVNFSDKPLYIGEEVKYELNKVEVDF
ncbi:efflux RND transporter periplasmic adaptor subunit [bacterium]|nr:efflux RND transporter periplasmic adaptor subunit [bacterium]